MTSKYNVDVDKNSPVQLDNLCATCSFWGGNTGNVVDAYENNATSMDFDNGWPEYGSCDISNKWLDLEITGDANVLTSLSANFGCVFWKKRNK